MVLYNAVKDKRKVLDVFYLIRGFPHGYLKGNLRIAFYDDLVITFPFREDPPFDDLYLRNVYYPYTPEDDHVVIDVGAHMGFFTLKVAKKVKRVIAFEPDPINFRFLMFNIYLNRFQDKVLAYNLALGERNSQVYLDRSKYGLGRVRISDQGSLAVKVRTLDTLMNEMSEIERVDLLKIDVEGYEYEVLQGASKTIQKYRPELLIAAYHYPEEYLRIAEYCRKANYEVLYYYVPLFLSCGKEVYIYAKRRVTCSTSREWL